MIYSAIYSGPPRNYTNSSTRKKYIAIHNTSNDASALNEASYAKNRRDGISSHYYVDNARLIQSLDTKNKAHHAGSSQGNTYAVSYEITGTNGKTRAWWLGNVRWDLLANQIVRDMKEFGISNDHLSISEIKAGKKTGIITHDDMRRAWGGTTHTDPGGNFPMDYLLGKIDQILRPPNPNPPKSNFPNALRYL